jgi:hypothetical protein
VYGKHYQAKQIRQIEKFENPRQKRRHFTSALISSRYLSYVAAISKMKSITYYIYYLLRSNFHPYLTGCIFFIFGRQIFKNVWTKRRHFWTALTEWNTTRIFYQGPAGRDVRNKLWLGKDHSHKGKHITEGEKPHLPNSLAIYAPMIYTAPCVMLLMRAASWLDAISQDPKKSRFPETNFPN